MGPGFSSSRTRGATSIVFRFGCCNLVSDAVPRSDAYMVYVGMLIETNAIVFTWGPPQGKTGEEVWSAIKRAIFSTPPDPAFEALASTPVETERPARGTPPITMTTRLPASTKRVTALVEAARRAAADAGFLVDGSRAGDGIVRVTAETDAGNAAVAMRFLDFGEEILMASNAQASGDAALGCRKSNVRSIQRSLSVSISSYLSCSRTIWSRS